jgi:hypothetical protein
LFRLWSRSHISTSAPAAQSHLRKQRHRSIIANWHGGSAPKANNLSLRLAGSLHALLLSAKAREPAPIYPSGAIADADMPTLLQAVLQRHDPELTAFIENAPQTKECEGLTLSS